jgi:hypothetical protein
MRGRLPTILALFAATAILLQPLACACFCLHAGEVSSQTETHSEQPACPHCGAASQASECAATATNSDHCPASPCPCCAEKHTQIELVLAAKVQPVSEETAAGFQILPLPLLDRHVGDPSINFLSHPVATRQTQGALRALLCCWLV